MSLDQLISKYLDGELNPREDSLLREIVGRNAEAHEKFDAYVDLHHAFKEDAKSINTPADLFRETEDLIMMKIMNETPVVKLQQPIRSFTSNKSKYLAAALIIVTLGSAVRFGDAFRNSGLDNFGTKSQSMTINLQASGEDINNSNADNSNSAGLSKSKSNVSKFFKNGTLSLASIASSEAVDQGIAEIKSLEQNSVETSVELKSNTGSNMNNSGLASIIPSTPENANKSQNSTLPSGNSAFISQPASDKQANNDTRHLTQNTAATRKIVDGLSFDPTIGIGFDFKPQVQLTTFFGRDFAKSGFNSDNNKPVFTFSQSLAYGIDNQNTLGIEGGFLDFTINDLVYVNVPAKNAVNYIKGEITSPKMGIEGFDPTGEHNYIQVPVMVNAQKRLIWGSIFFEREIMDNSIGSLQARVGVGASQEGLMSFGRLFGKLHLMYGIYMTAGAEGKFFDATERVLSGDKNGLKGTFSIIYGIQFKL